MKVRKKVRILKVAGAWHSYIPTPNGMSVWWHDCFDGARLFVSDFIKLRWSD